MTDGLHRLVQRAAVIHESTINGHQIIDTRSQRSRRQAVTRCIRSEIIKSFISELRKQEHVGALEHKHGNVHRGG